MNQDQAADDASSLPGEMARGRNSLLHILIMDEFNNSLNHGTGSSSRSSSNSSRNHSSHQTRLERIRRTIRARASESLDARRRRSQGLLPGEDIESESSSATASPGKRRKIEQHQAQIDMAQLELELAYCDGGKHKEAHTRPDAVLYENEEGEFAVLVLGEYFLMAMT